MILVDTSVWIDHFRGGNRRLKSMLYNDQVLTHPFVVGELTCGMVGNRKEILRLLSALPETQLAEHQEVFSLVENHHLYGRGIGWVDAHLLASTLLSGAVLWTFDKHLSEVAVALKVSS